MKSNLPARPERRILFQQFARIGHALASPGRLAMVSLLAHGEKSVDQLAQATGQTLATASAHLKVLRGSGLVLAEKRGRQVFCRLASESAVRLWLSLRDLGAELLPEARQVVRQFETDPQALARLSPVELAEELEQDRVTLIDLRPPEEFATGHLPAARNLPYARLGPEALAALGLRGRHPVYVYCRGPYCVMAREGVRQLRDLGLRVQRLRFSVPEWRAAELPVETGPAARPSPRRSSRTSSPLRP